MSLFDRVAEVFGEDRVVGLLKGLGRRMQIAEELCDGAGNPPGLFKALQPTDVLYGKDVLYKPHARELTDRALAGQDLRPGTKAEVLAGLLEASLKAPLNPSGLALAEKLFRDCTGIDLGADIGREDYPGHLDEMLAEASHKLRQEDRRLPKPA